MTIDKLTSIYIAPANLAGKALTDRLRQQSFNIACMADNLKQGQNIINNAAQVLPNTIVVIAAGSFLHPVASGLQLRGFHKYQLRIEDDNAHIKTYLQPLSYWFQQAATTALTLVFNTLRLFTPHASYLYYAEDFFDNNVLLAYHEHRIQYPQEAWLLGRKLRQHIKEFEADSHVPEVLSWVSLWRCLTAKKLIFDHEYTGDIIIYAPTYRDWGNNDYPWQAYDTALITDYSSIAYDFLLTNKPIIYYQYDFEKYRELRGETLVSDKDFIAGSVLHNQTDLQLQLTQLLNSNGGMELRQARKALTKKFLLNSDPAASEIVSYIRHDRRKVITEQADN